MTPTTPARVTPSTAYNVGRCRLGLHDFILDINFCPDANLDNMREVMPSPKGIPLILANENGPGLFQITLRQVSPDS